MTHVIASTYEHVPAGTHLVVEETDASGWSLVTHDAKPVWVPAAWLKPITPEPTADDLPPPPPPPPDDEFGELPPPPPDDMGPVVSDEPSMPPPPPPADDVAPAQVTSNGAVIVVDGASSFYVKALYTFEAQDADELPFQAGQTFKVLHSESGEWWFGECDGKMGHFPADYVEKTEAPMSQAEISALQQAVMQGSAAGDDSDDDDDDDDVGPAMWSAPPPPPDDSNFSIPPPPAPVDLDSDPPPRPPPPAGYGGPQVKPKPVASGISSRLENIVGGLPPGRPPFGMMPNSTHTTAPVTQAATVSAAPQPGSGDAPAPRRKAPPPPAGVTPVKRRARPKSTANLMPPKRRASELPKRSSSGSLSIPAPAQRSASVSMLQPPRTATERREQEQIQSDIAHLKIQLRSWKSTDGSPSNFNPFKTGQLMKISKGKHQCRNFYLFDNLLVYAKREKGKLDIRGKLPTCDIIVKDVADGSLKHGKNLIRNAFEVSNMSKSKWYVLYATTFEEKRAWMQALENERSGLGSLQASVYATINRAPGKGFGFEMAEVTPGRSEGARVARVNSPDLCPGVQAGDRLWQINGIGVHRLSLDEVIKLLYMTPEGATVEVELKR